MTHPATHVWKPSWRFLSQSILKNDVHPICVRIQQPLRGKGFSLVWNTSLYLCFFLLILTFFICKKWYNLKKQNKRIQINTPVSGNAKSWFFFFKLFYSITLFLFSGPYLIFRYILSICVNHVGKFSNCCKLTYDRYLRNWPEVTSISFSFIYLCIRKCWWPGSALHSQEIKNMVFNDRQWASTEIYKLCCRL